MECLRDVIFVILALFDLPQVDLVGPITLGSEGNFGASLLEDYLEEIIFLESLLFDEEKFAWGLLADLFLDQFEVCPSVCCEVERGLP